VRRLFEVNSEPHTGARPSVRLCVGLIIPHRCAAAVGRARAGPMMPRRCAADEESARAGPWENKGVVVSRGSAWCAWVRSFKKLSPSPTQGLGKGIPVLCCGWPAVASGQGDVVRGIEMGSGY
jgi:hypothetical protein